MEYLPGCRSASRMLCRSGGRVRSNTDFQIFSGFGGTRAGALSPDPGSGLTAPGALNGDENGFLRPRAGLPRPIRLGVAGEPSESGPSLGLIGVAMGESKVFVVGRSGARDGVCCAVVRGSSSRARARARFAGLGWGALRPVPSRKPAVGGGFEDPGAGSSNNAFAAAKLASEGCGADRPVPNVNPDSCGDGRDGEDTGRGGDEAAGPSNKALAAARRSALGRGVLPPVPNANPDVDGPASVGGSGRRLGDPCAIASSLIAGELELADGNSFSTSSSFLSRSSSVFLRLASCSSTSRSASRISFCARRRAASLGPFRRLPPAVPNDTVAGMTAGIGVGERKSSNGSEGRWGWDDGGGSADVSYRRQRRNSQSRLKSSSPRPSRSPSMSQESAYVSSFQSALAYLSPVLGS